MHILKLSFFSILFVFSSFVCQAQNNIQWSKFNKNKGYTPEIFFLDNNYYLIKQKSQLFGGNSLNIQKFSSLVGEKITNDIPLKYNRKKLTYLKTVNFDNNLWVFSEFRNASKKTVYLFCEKLNLKSLVIKGEKQKVCEGYYRGGKGINFDLIYSPDSTKLLIMSQNNTKNRDETSMQFYVYGKDMILLNQSISKIPFNQQDFTIRSVKLDNKGKIYVLGIVDESKLFKNKESAVIVSINNDKSKIFKLGLKEGKYISDLDFSFLENGDIACVGLYSNKDYKSAQGIVNAHLSFDGKIKSLTTDNFDATFMDEGKSNFSKSFTKGRNKRLRDFQIKDIIPDGNNGSVLLAEQFYITSETYSVRGQNRLNNETEYTYHFGDLIAIYISKKGKIKWTHKIQKHYSSTANFEAYGSFNYIRQENGIILLYNGHIKNIDMKDGDKFKRGSSYNTRTFYKTMINFEGNSNTHALGQSRDFKLDIYPGKSKKINDELILIYGFRRNVERFGILKI